MCLALYGVHAATVVTQSFVKHVSTIEALFSLWSVPRLYGESRKLEELRRGQGSYEEIVAAEEGKQSELEPGAQKSTRCQPVKI
jgi:hypothetical protein